MAYTWTDWSHGTDDGGHAIELDWTSPDTLRGRSVVPVLDALRQAVVERCEISGPLLVAPLVDPFPQNGLMTYGGAITLALVAAACNCWQAIPETDTTDILREWDICQEVNGTASIWVKRDNDAGTGPDWRGIYAQASDDVRWFVRDDGAAVHVPRPVDQTDPGPLEHATWHHDRQSPAVRTTAAAGSAYTIYGFGPYLAPWCSSAPAHYLTRRGRHGAAYTDGGWPHASWELPGPYMSPCSVSPHASQAGDSGLSDATHIYYLQEADTPRRNTLAVWSAEWAHWAYTLLNRLQAIVHLPDDVEAGIDLGSTRLFEELAGNLWLSYYDRTDLANNLPNFAFNRDIEFRVRGPCLAAPWQGVFGPTTTPVNLGAHVAHGGTTHRVIMAPVHFTFHA